MNSALPEEGDFLTGSEAAPCGTVPSPLDISALIPDSVDREAISAIAAAYENTLQALGLTGRSDAITEIIARKIIDIAQTGECDPARIQSRAISSLGALE